MVDRLQSEVRFVWMCLRRLSYNIRMKPIICFESMPLGNKKIAIGKRSSW
jgi:hypothetical protein